ncbi:MAG: calcium/sodium antiporter [Chloroflexi bacterium]|nr:calcium/sodium antiporter [Chloroflexota bacterium]
MLDVVYVLLGLIGLFLGGNWLVLGASRLAASLGVPPVVIGLTVVAFGTSMPELLVCLDAALRGASDIAIGNVVGSNIANIGLILGVSGVIMTIPIHIQLIRREIPIMILASLVVYALALDGTISGVDGLLLVAGLLAFMAALIVLSRHERLKPAEERELAEEEHITGSINRLFEIGRLLAGMVVLLTGANLLVTGAVNLARALGVSEIVIGLTLVAFGTSLPELVTAIIAAVKRHDDILFGNVIGSNIFNLLGILGITALARPVPVAVSVLQFDLLVMIAFALLVLPFSLNRLLLRREAAVLLAGYGGFIALTVLAAGS